VTITFNTDEAGHARVELTKSSRRVVTRRVGAGGARIGVGRLSAGTWRVIVTVTDAAGSGARPQHLTVRVKR
jgi:hypothetical protein